MDRIFYEFPHSHFCEKARWALDHKGLAFERRYLLPPWHIAVTRRYGKRTSVPVLLEGGEAVQGSSEIINHLDDRNPQKPLTLGDRAAAVTLEKSLDKSLGVPLRVFFYHHTLPFKDFVCDAFLQGSGPVARRVFRLQYPVVAKAIRSSYRIDATTAAAARDKVLAELDRLHELKGTAPYFGGDMFSRIDITVAALLAFIPQPPEHPLRWLPFPAAPELLEFASAAREHPLSAWILKVYREHRS